MVAWTAGRALWRGAVAFPAAFAVWVVVTLASDPLVSGATLAALDAALVFAGFGLYGQLGSTTALLVVAGIWAVLLLVSPLWMRRFRFGPVEWLWRTMTYGTRQPMRTR